MNIKKCKCGADIAFITMESGKKMPVDAKPENMVQLPDPVDDIELANFRQHYTEPQGKMVKVYRPHWGTCPLAAGFKKKKGG